MIFARNKDIIIIVRYDCAKNFISRSYKNIVVGGDLFENSQCIVNCYSVV